MASLLPVAKLWVWISALASVAGWGLSAIGQLNTTGYLVFTAVSVAIYWSLRQSPSRVQRPDSKQSARRLQRRFSRWLPALFLLLAGLAFVGGALYPPTNHAGLTYRTPRVLQWLSEQGWHWIHTPSYRMNNRTCGFEWLSAPLLLFTGTDRLLFLLNFIPFILLPGQIFSVFTRLGISSRVAWYWMWLLPTGYCFLFQAGSIGNDAFPTAYATAALDFALRARQTGRFSDGALSFLAAGMLTGAKASNAPLLLGWGLLWLAMSRQGWGSIFAVRSRLAGARVLQATAVVLMCVVVSLVPTAFLNIHYCGDWTGLSLERAGMDMKNPVVGLWGNALLFALHNFVPPLLPMAKTWNEKALDFLPQAIVNPLNANFEAGYHLLWELPTEDWVGLGFGVSVLLALSCVAALARRTSGFMRNRLVANDAAPALPRWLYVAVLFSPWIALMIYCAKSGMVTGARIIAPYYPLLALGLLAHGGHIHLVHAKWWRSLCLTALLICIPLVVLTPARPLWPAITVLGRLASDHHNSRLLQRAHKVYAVYRTRHDPLWTVRNALPPGIRTVGFMADGDDMDISLWRPFFSRTVSHVLWKDSGESIRARQIRYVVVGGAYLESLENPRGAPASTGREPALLREWLHRVNGRVISSHIVTLKVNEGPKPWYVIHLD